MIEQDDVNINETIYDEERIMDRLIIMDDVLGIADSSKEFADFLTVSRKYRYHCVYVFHKIIPEKEIWRKIISQTNIFNIFPCSVPYNTVSKILQSNCVPTTTKYVPVRSMRLTRVFLDLASRDEQSCLTIDCTTINKNGPSRYRTKADNPVEQLFYFNEPGSDQVYDIFISKRINSGNFEKGIYVKIDRVLSETDIETFSTRKTLEKNGPGNDRLSKRNRESTNDSTDGEGQEIGSTKISKYLLPA